MSAPPVIGILLAAGKGSRMGTTKQLLSVPTTAGDKPLVAAAFDAVAPACDFMIVVVGHDRTRVIDALAGRVFTVAESSPDAEMIESVQIGIQAAGVVADSRRESAEIELSHSARATYWALLHLADHPHVDPRSLQQLITARTQFPEQAIIPRYASRGGHPILIPSTVADKLINRPMPQGLRAYWQQYPKTCHYIEVHDAGVTTDLDTVEDLDQYKASARNG